MVDHLVARAGKGTIPISVVTKRDYKAWLKKQNKATQNWLKGIDHSPESGQVALVPDRNGAPSQVVLTVGDRSSPWGYASVAARLPKGRYAFDDTLTADVSDAAALGVALAGYRFERYKPAKKKLPTIVWPKDADREHVTRIYEGIALGRDLVNTPAEHMGPEDLVAAGTELAKQHGAKVTVTAGDKLLDKGYPAIHAVGRASERPPRLLDLRWGDAGAPKITLVGKGVCFDTGGLDLKTAAGMKLMKKDMGGAASVFALAHMIMDAQLPVRLRVLVPAVENAVSGRAYRPGDVLETRKGLTVEVGNTDAEGRLILCDALAEADEEAPDVLIDFATLTGAARVALGAELPALFCDDKTLVDEVLTAGDAQHDPLWRMPLYAPYRRHLDSSIAHLNNIANNSYGGAITAALFLREFVSRRQCWAHIDTMAWNTSSRPGRPSGGEIFGVRAFFEALRTRYAE